MFAASVDVCSPRLPEWLAGFAVPTWEREMLLRGGTASNEIGQVQGSQGSQASHVPAKLALAMPYGC